MKIDKYTCENYREDMMLLGLKISLKNDNLSDKEKRRIIKEIKSLELKIKMDG
jgi:hypothetical protein